MHRAMVLLGFSDEEEEMDIPVSYGAGARRMERDGYPYGYDSRRDVDAGYSETEQRRDPEPPSRRVEPERRSYEPPRRPQYRTEQRFDISEPELDQEPPRPPSTVQVFPAQEAPNRPTVPKSLDTRGDPSPLDRTGVIRPIGQRDQPKMHIAHPMRFSDVQDIGDRIKVSQPVIVNLEGVEKELYRRVVDFCSGVTYALDGKMKKVGEQVFLLTPSNVDVAQEEVDGLTQRSTFRRNQP